MSTGSNQPSGSHGRHESQSDEHSKADLSDISGKNTPDHERNTMGSDNDLEKQAIEQLPAEEESGAKVEQVNDPSIVEFDGPDDPANPKNWAPRRRVAITISMGVMAFVVTFSSSIFAVCVKPVAEEYGIGNVTATLGVSLFLLGFVIGPVLFGPASEVYGRRIPLFGGYIAFAIFNIPVAVARNVETIMLGRFLGGLTASAPIAVVGGALADMWNPVERSYAICMFASGTFCGPVVGPIVGGFVTESSLGWRWTSWLTLIMASIFGTIGLFVIPETSAPRILQLRARRLRFETKNWALHAKAEETPVTLRSICTVYLMRPWIMLVQEPILAYMTAYMSFLYGVLYLLFLAYPVSFHEERGWSLGVSSLPFVSFIVGIFMGNGLMVYSAATNFKRAYLKYGKPVPEERLPPMIVCAIILPIAFFWFGWTSSPSITWVPQVISSAFIGMSTLVLFWQGANFIIDTYGFYANSAMAINAFIRGLAGAAFPLFAVDMYRSLGVPWASSLLGFLCVAFLPAPILFYKYGAKIRAKSKWNPAG